MVEPVNGPLRRAVLLRHGRTAWNAERRWQGHLDVPLDVEGLAQAERVAQLLAQDGAIASLTFSDLRRAAQTAAVIKGAFDLAGRPLRRREDARLREVDMGQWAGLTHDEVAARFPEDCAAIAAGVDVRRGGDGETMGEAVRRARAGFADAVALVDAGEAALFVLHGAVLRALVVDMCDIPSAVAHRALGSVGNCCWVDLVETAPGSWHIQTWNAHA